MRDVITRAGHFGQQNIAGHHDVFGAAGNAAQAEAHGFEALMHVAAGAEVQILAMVDHGDAEAAGELHGAAHHARVHHRTAVVGNRDGAGVDHRADGGQFLARAALGDGADGPHVDHRVPRAFSTM